MKTIYISIPSIEDIEVIKTIENAFESADSPSRIFVGVSIMDKKDKTFLKIKSMSETNKNISASYTKLTKNSFLDMGTGMGRFRAASMYNDQDYMLQIDSHTMFLAGWDTTLIKLFEEFESEYGSDRFILTGYLPGYTYKEDGSRVSFHNRLYYPYFLPNNFFLDKIPCWDMMDLESKITDKFIPCVKFNGNFVFGSKHFINNSGRYKDAVFYDEEMIQSFNLIGQDTAMVFPNIENFPLHHLYTEEINKYGGKREYFSTMFGDEIDREFTKRSVSNYLNYVSDPQNTENVRKYEKYARINAKKGAISEKYSPKKFTVEENK